MAHSFFSFSPFSVEIKHLDIFALILYFIDSIHHNTKDLKSKHKK